LYMDRLQARIKGRKAARMLVGEAAHQPPSVKELPLT
jgi:hypothetical protein